MTVAIKGLTVNIPSFYIKNSRFIFTSKKKPEMKFNPLTKEIYTDKGEFIKKMNCPYKMNWDNFEEGNLTSRKCAICEHLITDTKNFSDEEMLNIVQQNPDICLKIDLNQNNIKIISNGILEQK